jgi:hypothetical protein
MDGSFRDQVCCAVMCRSIEGIPKLASPRVPGASPRDSALPANSSGCQDGRANSSSPDCHLSLGKTRDEIENAHLLAIFSFLQFFSANRETIFELQTGSMSLLGLLAGVALATQSRLRANRKRILSSRHLCSFSFFVSFNQRVMHRGHGCLCDWKALLAV